jgi:Tol biopolymer transport system component
MARLQHPHILPVYDVGEHEGIVFLVMPYIEGGTLHDRLVAQRRAGLLDVAAMLSILEPLGDALDYAHLSGVIHRDIKPHNILLTARGYPFLMDFGIAKMLTHDTSTASLTLANTVIGTPEYISPEQAQGLPIDGRADLYSLGVILYECFTGRPPFRAESVRDTPLGILIRQASATPPAPRTINPHVTPAQEAVLLRALAKHPDDRFPTGAALFEAIRETLPARDRHSTLLTLPVAPRQDAQIPSPPNVPLPGRTPGGTPPQALPEVAPLAVAAPVLTPPPSAFPAEAPVTAEPAVAMVASGRPPRGRLPIYLLVGSVLVALALLGGLVAITQREKGASIAPTTAIVGNTSPGSALIVAPITPSLPATATVSPPTVTTVDSPTTVVGLGTPSSAGAIGTGTPVLAVGTRATTRRQVILFSSHRNGVHDSQIYSMNIDGSDQRQLTFTSGHSWGPRISPDGKFFVFSSVAPGEHVDHSATGGGEIGQGHHEIFRANADGTNIVRLTTTTAWNNAWAWAPDGQSLIIASDRDGEWELYRMSANGEQAGIVRLTFNTAQDGWPSFTPDGKNIVFASDRDGGMSQIYIMDADGTNARRLNFSESYDTLPDVSPDGKRIVYSVQNGTAQTGTTSEIYVMNIDGSNATRLTNTVATNTDPSWSPDGSQIVFSSNRAGNTNIYVMNVDGSGLKQLTTEPGEDVTPFWGFIETTADAPPSVAQGFSIGVSDAAILPNITAQRRGKRRGHELAVSGRGTTRMTE